jgi:Uncharacterized conserved protein
MRLSFRPLPLFTLVTILIMAGFVALGIWQLHRLQWKLGLIAEANRALVSAPLTLDQAIARGKDSEYHPVALHGRFAHQKEAFVYAIANGVPVYHVLTPFVMDDGRVMMIDRGIIPEELRNPKKRAAGNDDGPVRVVGIWRKPDPPSAYTPGVDGVNGLWYARDLDHMAEAAHVKLAAPMLLEADKTPNRGGWPKGGQTIVTFRNAHLQYAITWFGLALTMLLCWLAVHISMKRLTFSR